MRIKKPYIIHNLSQNFSIITDGVKETQDFLRDQGCSVDNNSFSSLAQDLDSSFNGRKICSKSGDVFEIDELWTGNYDEKD